MRTEKGARLGGRYELVEPIAVGGMGEVWRARDGVLGRDVAVKVLKAEYTGDPGFLERFRGEARHAAALSHPHIAAVYDYGEADDDDAPGRSHAYLVMELVPGEPLSSELGPRGRAHPGADDGPARPGGAGPGGGARRRRGAPRRQAGQPAGDARAGQVKVTDFGIARAGDAVPLTATGQVMGTAAYLAPEQALGRPATPASDVYALGVVAYEALTGARPFGGDSPVAQAMAHVNDTPPPLPARLPQPVRALVQGAMDKQASARPGRRSGVRARGGAGAPGPGAHLGRRRRPPHRADSRRRDRAGCHRADVGRRLAPGRRHPGDAPGRPRRPAGAPGHHHGPPLHPAAAAQPVLGAAAGADPAGRLRGVRCGAGRQRVCSAVATTPPRARRR